MNFETETGISEPLKNVEPMTQEEIQELEQEAIEAKDREMEEHRDYLASLDCWWLTRSPEEREHAELMSQIL